MVSHLLWQSTSDILGGFVLNTKTVSTIEQTRSPNDD